MTKTFYPPDRTLMGPGPSDVSPRVLQAMARPTIGHLDPAFIALMDDIKRLTQFAFQTKNNLTLPLSAPGSAGMEACFVNLIEPGDKVIVCSNGVFGLRMRECVERSQGQCILVENDWGKAVDLDLLEQALARHQDAKAVAFVHAETSTGALSDAKQIATLAQKYDCLVIADMVTSLGGCEVNVDDWGIDAAFSGTQKCLSCVPGISPLTFSPKAEQVIRQRKTKVQSWFLDMTLVMNYWGESAQRSYHHTAPVNALYAYHEALLDLEEEGLAASWRRHQQHHLALLAGLQAMGLNLLVAPAERLPQLNVVCVPEGIDENKIRQFLLQHHQLEIGAGLGGLAGKVWRIGLMGQSCSKKNVLLCLSALESGLIHQGYRTQAGLGVSAALEIYSGYRYTK